MTTSSKLFEPYKLGPISLPNRFVMAPLTRNRAGAGMVPSPLAVEYYGQRASAGLLITEASQISQQGQGYQDTPGIYSKQQVAGWRKVTERVHARGGRIFIQLWHVGRISHTSLQPNNGCGLLSEMSLDGVTGDMRMPVRSGPASEATAFATSSISLARFSIDPP